MIGLWANDDDNAGGRVLGFKNLDDGLFFILAGQAGASISFHIKNVRPLLKFVHSQLSP